MRDEEKLDLIGCGVNIGSRWSKQNTIAELENIKAEIHNMLKSDEVKNEYWGYLIYNKAYLFINIIDKRISELKGE